MDEAKKILKSYYHFWERFKKDSTCDRLSAYDIDQLNLAHRHIFGSFADTGCNECIVSMFKVVFNWYDNHKSPDENTDFYNMNYKDLIDLAKKKGKTIARNISKTELINLVK